MRLLNIDLIIHAILLKACITQVQNRSELSFHHINPVYISIFEILPRRSIRFGQIPLRVEHHKTMIQTEPQQRRCRSTIVPWLVPRTSWIVWSVDQVTLRKSYKQGNTKICGRIHKPVTRGNVDPSWSGYNSGGQFRSTRSVHLCALT